MVLCQLLGPDLKKLEASTHFFLEHSLLEPTHHPLGKPKQLHGESHVEGNQGFWLTSSNHLPAMWVSHAGSGYPAVSKPLQVIPQGQRQDIATLLPPNCRWLSKINYCGCFKLLSVGEIRYIVIDDWESSSGKHRPHSHESLTYCRVY